MTMTLLWCNLFQLFGLGFVLSAGISKHKQWILFLTLCANLCSTAVMFLAGRYDGVAATIVCTVRSFLFLFQDRVEHDGIFWGCVAAHALVGILAWQSPLSLLIIVAPIVLCSVNWFGGVRAIKYGTIVSDCCWAVFDLSCGVYIEGGRDIAEVLSNVIGLLRTQKRRTSKGASV